jgi:hypothetical protein
VEEGRLRIYWDAGEIVGVSVNAALDSAYERLFKTAQGELQQANTSIDVGIRLIVFGCFWLEAVCNETFRDTLLVAVSPRRFAEALWKANRRAGFLDKLLILSAFLKDPESEHAGDLLRELKKVFDLRNRLAHFKDEDTPVAAKFEIKDFDPGQYPDAELVVQLRPPYTEGYARTILDGISCLVEIRQVHFKRRQYFPETVEDSGAAE